jgi:hypothetical protein
MGCEMVFNHLSQTKNQLRPYSLLPSVWTSFILIASNPVRWIKFKWIYLAAVYHITISNWNFWSTCLFVGNHLLFVLEQFYHIAWWLLWFCYYLDLDLLFISLIWDMCFAA